MSCDLINGRLLNDCLANKAGIHTLFYARLSSFKSLTGVVIVDGVITSLGPDPITIYRFEMGNNVGVFNETLTRIEKGLSFIQQEVTLSIYDVRPEDLSDLNVLKRGRWAIWAMDYDMNIRLFGMNNGMMANGGSDVSGQAAGDKKGLDLIFDGREKDYALFMDGYTTNPFDNFGNVTVSPSYAVEIITTLLSENSFVLLGEGGSALIEE